MHQAVEDGVGQGRGVDPAMPVLDGQLAGQDGGVLAGAVVDHFQQVVPATLFQWGLAPFTAEQRRDMLELLDERYDQRSTLVTSQMPVEKWHEPT